MPDALTAHQMLEFVELCACIHWDRSGKVLMRSPPQVPLSPLAAS